MTGAAVTALSVAVLGCGGKDYPRRPKPPVPLQIGGVITDQKVTVSPSAFGAGPVTLVVSNQDRVSHTITLQGQGIRERVGPINPGDTATLQKSLKRGRYAVQAGSERALPREITPARLEVGNPRPNGNDYLTFP